MTSRHVVFVVVAVVAVVILGFLLRWSTGADAPERDSLPKQSARASGGVEGRAARPAPREPSSDDPESVGSALSPHITEAYDSLGDLLPFRITCTAPDDLPDGAYQVEPPGVVEAVLVEQGRLTALVREPSGEAPLRNNLLRVALLRWTDARPGVWNGCSLAIPDRVRVDGRLEWPDGSPAADYPLQTCEHGVYVRSDADGRFAFEALAGMPCWLVGVVDDGSGFGRGPSVGVTTDGDVSGVTVRLPGDDERWDPGQYERAAASLEGMIDRKLGEQEARVERFPDPGEVKGGAGELLSGWVRYEEDKLRSMEELAEDLRGTDPERRRSAVRAFMFGGYF